MYLGPSWLRDLFLPISLSPHLTTPHHEVRQDMQLSALFAKRYYPFMRDIITKRYEICVEGASAAGLSYCRIVTYKKTDVSNVRERLAAKIGTVDALLVGGEILCIVSLWK